MHAARCPSKETLLLADESVSASRGSSVARTEVFCRVCCSCSLNNHHISQREDATNAALRYKWCASVCFTTRL